MIELFTCGIKLKCTPLDTDMLPLLLHTRSRVSPSAQIFCHLKIQFANCHPRTLWVVNRGDLKLFTSPGPNICKCSLTAHASFLLNVYDYTTLFSLCFDSIEITWKRGNYYLETWHIKNRNQIIVSIRIIILSLFFFLKKWTNYVLRLYSFGNHVLRKTRDNYEAYIMRWLPIKTQKITSLHRFYT